MTDSDQPPSGADDGEPQPQTPTTSQDGDDPADPDQLEHNPTATVSHSGEDDAEPEPSEPDGPEDWQEIESSLSEDEIIRRLSAHKIIEYAHNRAGWLHRMAQLPLVRALYAKMRGHHFEQAVKKATGISKTHAYHIVSWLYGDRENVPKIWDKVVAESHEAKMRGDGFEYPSLSKMLNWYKPPDESDGKDSDESDGDDESDDTGGNDPRSKSAIIRSELGFKDQAESLSRDLVRIKERLACRDRDYDEVSAQADERKRDLELVRELMAEEKRKAAAALAELAARDSEIERLKALVPTNDNNGGDPDPDPDPDPQAKRTIADMTATEIDPKWGAKKRIGGSRMADYDDVVDRRIKTYALLHHEPDVIARATAETLNARTPIFFRQVKPEMDLDTIPKLPEKPEKE